MKIAVAGPNGHSPDRILAPASISGAVGARLLSALLVVPCVLLLVFVILLRCASPEPDDFGIAATWHDIGLVGTLKDLYQNWSGRLPGISLSLLPFMLHERSGIDLLSAYRICCAGTIVCILVASFWCAQLLLPDRGGKERLLVALLLTAALVVGAPAPEAVLFRFSEAGFYAVPGITLFLMIIWFAAKAGDRISPLQIGVLSIASFSVALSSEFSGIALALLIGGSFARRCLIEGCPKHYAAHALLLSIAIFGTLVVVLAPGNVVRLNASGIHESLIVRAISSVPSTAFDVVIFLIRRLTNPALIGGMLTLLALSSAFPRRPQSAGNNAVVIVFPLLLTLIIITEGLWIGRIATGEMLVQGAQNELHFVLVASLALTAVILGQSYEVSRFIKSAIARLHFASLRTALIALSLLMLLTPKFLLAAWVLTSSGVAGYSNQVASRFSMIDDERLIARSTEKKDVVLPRLPDESDFFKESLREDPRYWTNQLLARYVGANSVRVEAHN